MPDDNGTPAPAPSRDDDGENQPLDPEEMIHLRGPEKGSPRPETGEADLNADTAAESDSKEGGGDASDGDCSDGDGDGDADGTQEDDDLDVEPWDELDAAAAQHKEDWRRPTQAHPEPVDGEALFVALVVVFQRFMVLPPGAAVVLALWVMMTYALHPCDLRFAVRIMITAAGANSGKTSLLDLLTYLVRRPDPTSDITPASFFRSLNDKKCVLIDECDHNLPSRAGTRNQMVQMVNSGHKRTSAVILRVESLKTREGTIKVTRRYPIFASVAMAGIGDFAPPTIKTRSFIVKLKRKMAREEVADFIADEHAPMMRELRSQIHRWVKDNKDAIRYCRPELDRDLMNNRQRDNATMLLQIADTIGPQCSARAREAIKLLTRGDTRDPNEMLLGDIASILSDPTIRVGNTGDPKNPPKPIGTDNAVFTKDLCDLIVKYFPDREIYQGFTQARLASMLRVFDIAPEPSGKRRGDDVWRWYRRDRFDPWFIRYGFIDSAAEPVIVVDDLPEGVTDGAPPETATPLQEETERSTVAPPTDSAPEPMGDTSTPQKGAPPEDVEAATATGEALDSSTGAPEIGYTNARVVPVGPGEKKRANRLYLEIGALVLAGTVDRANVSYISSRFWVIALKGQPCFFHIADDDSLECLPIDGVGLLADCDTSSVRINLERVLSVSDSDFTVLRPLVDKYRKSSVE